MSKTFLNVDFTDVSHAGEDFTNAQFLNCTFAASSNFAGCCMMGAHFNVDSRQTADAANWSGTVWEDTAFTLIAPFETWCGLSARPADALTYSEQKDKEAGVIRQSRVEPLPERPGLLDRDERYVRAYGTQYRPVL